MSENWNPNTMGPDCDWCGECNWCAQLGGKPDLPPEDREPGVEPVDETTDEDERGSAA